MGVGNSHGSARRWLSACVAVLVLAPMAAPAILFLIVAPLVVEGMSARDVLTHRPSAASSVLLVATLYLIVNASWSMSPPVGYAAAATLACVGGVIHLANGALIESGNRLVRAMSIGLCAGLLAGAAFICVEVVSAQSVLRIVTTLLPAMRPHERHMLMENGWVVFLEPSILNRSLAIMTLLIWPALLLIGVGLGLPRRQRIWLLLAFVPLAGAILRSEHATSKIALAGGALTFILFTAAPALTRRLIVVGWAAATLLVVPAASLAYSSGLYQSEWLASTAKQRIVIWGYTSEQVVKAPWFGVGLGTTRTLHHDPTQVRERAPGTNYERTTHWHTHNDFLQTWYEAGAVGAVLLFAIGLMTMRSMARVESVAQPYLHAAFVSCALMAASSFSLWQPWFLASFGSVAVFSMVAAHCTEHRVMAGRASLISNTTAHT
jgi:O-antigen ligase